MSKPKTSYSVVFILALIWAVHFFVLGFLNQDLSPFATGACTRFVTFLILTGVLLCKRQMHILYPFSAEVIIKLICVGVLGFLLDWTSFVGFQHSSANTGTVLLKTDVVFANLLSVLLLKERLRWSDVLLTGTMLAGVLMVLGIDPLQLQLQIYDLFFILSALFVTLNAFLIQHLQHRHGVENTVIAYYNNLVTFLLFTVFMLVTGPTPQFSALRWKTVLMILSCGATQAAIYHFYYRSLARFPVWIVKNVLLLIPVITMVLSFVFLRSIPSLSHLIGAVIVLSSASAILLSQRKAAKSKPPAKPEA